MVVSREDIHKAKEKLDVDNAYWMAEILELQEFDEHNLKSLCPFHKEDTPSFIYDKKRFSFHCFGACGRGYDIIDVLMMKRNYTYVQAAQALFERAGIKHSFGEVGVKTKPQYRYPDPTYAPSKDKVYAYMKSRGISEKTVDYLNIEQDAQGNMLFQYYDVNDVLTVCKVRPSRRVEKSEKMPKIWYLKDEDGVPFDHAQILYNMNKVNADAPLLITSGEGDCAAAIEAGWTNAVSIPGGDSNTQWVSECWDWLEQFDEIIICPDNDKSGAKYCKDIVPRLGSWRCRVAAVPEEVEYKGKTKRVNDLNELLFFAGKEAVMHMISTAKATPVPSVVGFNEIKAMDMSEMDGVQTGFSGIDSDFHKLFYGSFNVISGYPGCVACGTEYFNGTEWKDIAKYTPGDKVLQYNEDGTANLVTPKQYHKYPCSTFYHLTTPTGIEQVISSDHMIVAKGEEGACKIPIREVVNGHVPSWNMVIPTAFRYVGGDGAPVSDAAIYEFCKGLSELCDSSYQVSSTWYKCNEHQLQTFYAALLQIYGERVNVCSKSLADLIQFVASAVGWPSAITSDMQGGYSVKIGATHYPSLSDIDCARTVPMGDGYKYCFTVPSGMLVLRRDNCINITGNSGKTSFLYGLICNVIDQSVPAWIYSRELPEWMSKNWMLHMLAGRRWHDEMQDKSGGVYYKVPKDIQDEISAHYDGSLYFYKDDYPNDAKSILTSMVDSARRYGCKFFLLDNLMTISLGGSDENKNERQTEFVNELIAFATKYQVVVVLVCHPNKQSDVMQNVGMYQISGTSNIINLSHRALGLRRVTKREKEGYVEGRKEYPPVDHDVVVSIIKDRFGGRVQTEYKMYYDEVDRRFYSNDEEYGRDYGWDSRSYKNKPTSDRLKRISDLDNEAFGEVKE